MPKIDAPLTENQIIRGFDRSRKTPAQRLKWVQELVAVEPSVDRRAHGQTLLCHAVGRVWPETVRWLLEQGADPNAVAVLNFGGGVVDAIPEVLSGIVDDPNWDLPQGKSSERTILDDLTRFGLHARCSVKPKFNLWGPVLERPWLAEWLVERGYPVDAADEQGNTWLHQVALDWATLDWADKSDRAGMKIKLNQALVHGAPIDAKNRRGKTPEELLHAKVFSRLASRRDPDRLAMVEFWHQQSDAARLERTLTQILPSDAPSRRRPRL